MKKWAPTSSAIIVKNNSQLQSVDSSLSDSFCTSSFKLYLSEDSSDEMADSCFDDRPEENLSTRSNSFSSTSWSIESTVSTPSPEHHSTSVVTIDSVGEEPSTYFYDSSTTLPGLMFHKFCNCGISSSTANTASLTGSIYGGNTASRQRHDHLPSLPSPVHNCSEGRASAKCGNHKQLNGKKSIARRRPLRTNEAWTLKRLRKRDVMHLRKQMKWKLRKQAHQSRVLPAKPKKAEDRSKQLHNPQVIPANSVHAKVAHQDVVKEEDKNKSVSKGKQCSSWRKKVADVSQPVCEDSLHSTQEKGFVSILTSHEKHGESKPKLPEVGGSNGKKKLDLHSLLYESDSQKIRNGQCSQVISNGQDSKHVLEYAQQITANGQDLKQVSATLPPSLPGLKYQDLLMEWQYQLNKQRSGSDDIIIVENLVDEEIPQLDFTYISSSFDGKGVPDPLDDSLVGCNCYLLGKRCGPKAEHCCSKMAGALYAYTSAGKIRIEPGNPIYECNSKCACPPDCTNRVVQHGRTVPLCVFRTSNGRGWGVKAINPIKANTFVSEYVGEIITCEEADYRGKCYDANGSTYLFDLDFHETDDDNSQPFSIDATNFGNISHFFNHSVS